MLTSQTRNSGQPFERSWFPSDPNLGRKKDLYCHVLLQNENLIPNKNEKFIRHVRTPEKFPFLLGGFVGNLDGAMAICHGENM